jgi:hypothetical protein
VDLPVAMLPVRPRSNMSAVRCFALTVLFNSACLGADVD